MIIPIDTTNSKNLEKEGVAAEVQRILKSCEVSEKVVSDVYLPSFSITHKAENLAIKGMAVEGENKVQESQETA